MRKVFLGAVVAAMAAACGGGQQTGPAPGTASTTAAATTGSPAPATTDTGAPAGTGTGAATAPAQSFGDKMRATGMGMMQALAAHDADKLASFYAQDAVLKMPGLPDVVGRDAIKQQMQAVFTAFPDMQIGVSRVFVHDHTAAAEFVWTGTMKGDMGPMHATNKPVGVPGINIEIYNDDGLVKEQHRYFDMHSEMEQMDPHAHAGTFRPIATLPTGQPEVHISKGSADEQSNTQVVTSMYGDMVPAKVDQFVALLADGVTWDDMAMPGPMSGKDNAKKFVGMQATAFPDGVFTPGTTIAADDFVVVEGVFTGTNKGPMPPILPHATNKSVTLHSVDVIQLSGGHVAHGWSYSNGFEFAQQLGLMPAPGGH
jgi:steroid delta-isomerase-like uncharacterized protein